MSEHRIHAWKLSTTALGCMACPYVAQAVMNVWVREREWLTLFLCAACAFRVKGDTALLQGFLGEKRVRESEAREFDVMCKKRRQGRAA